ncbi:MAG: hypothetical protein NTW00_04615 [Hyphomicrobiales bacterium]|nr:hypothetical protein [Hyphomicrobiales bacterium]
MSTNIGTSSAMMTRAKPIDRVDRFPADVIEHAVWLYVRFPISLLMISGLVLKERKMAGRVMQ